MISQAPRRWVSSPLGINILLAICGGTSARINKYVQIYKLQKDKKEIKSGSILYHSPCFKSEQILKKSYLSTDITETRTLNTFYNWVDENLKLNDNNIDDKFPTASNLILSNITYFKGSWSLPEVAAGPLMKVYNSFNYTQDVKYEARIIELPIQDPDFKLAIILPNEADVLHKLFERLTTEGLTAAVNSVQPLFTATTQLNAPGIDIVSKIGLKCENINEDLSKTAIQYATAKINAEGAQVEVLTNIYSALAETPAIADESKVENPFYFAITFRDMPIFTGQYTQE